MSSMASATAVVGVEPDVDSDEELLATRYELLQELGGHFSRVYKARNRESGEIFAVKKQYMRDEGVDVSTIREIALLRQCKHSNIIRLHDVVRESNAVHGATLCIVLECLDCNLRQYLRKHGPMKQLSCLQSATLQMMRGVACVHIHGILHRDVRPENLLIDEKHFLLKVADFGFARHFTLPIRAYTRPVQALWYRCPEIILGAVKYGTPIDIWSAGCIMAEMATGKPLFPADSEVGMIMKIYHLLGTPTEEVWPGCTQLPEAKARFPKWRSTQLEPVLRAAPVLGEKGIHLLSSMLSYDPLGRPPARRVADEDAFFEGFSGGEHHNTSSGSGLSTAERAEVPTLTPETVNMETEAGVGDTLLFTGPDHEMDGLELNRESKMRIIGHIADQWKVKLTTASGEISEAYVMKEHVTKRGEKKPRSDSMAQPQPNAANGGSALTTPEKQTTRSASKSSMIRLRGLPFNAKVQDVYAFFAQYDLVDRISSDHSAVTILTWGLNCKPSGQATVQMNSPVDAEVAQMRLHEKCMGQRYIEVFVQADTEERLTPAKTSQPVGAQAPGAAYPTPSCNAGTAAVPWGADPNAADASNPAWDAIFNLMNQTMKTQATAAAAAVGGQQSAQQAQLDFMSFGHMPPLPCAMEGNLGLPLLPPCGAGAPVDGPNTLRVASLL